MAVLLKDNHSCLFVHIPKCGGSSFEEMARRAGWAETFSVRGINSTRLRMFNCTPQHFHADLLERTFDIDRFDVVLALVRHPFDRLKSEYYWQVKQGATDLPPEVWWPKTVADYAKNPFLFDNHIRPQSEFLVKSDKLEHFALEKDGVRRAFNRLPGASMVDRARYALQNPVHEKRANRDDAIERAFAGLRSDIEAFYEKDMIRFAYATAP